MSVEVKVPEVGESVQEAVIVQWYGKDGDWVEQGAVLFVIETDKVTLEVAAEASGVLRVLVPEGSTVAIGAVVGQLEDKADGEAVAAPAPAISRAAPKAAAAADAAEPAPAGASAVADGGPLQAVGPITPAEPAMGPAPQPETAGREGTSEPPILSPAVRRLVQQHRLDPTTITASGPGGRLTKGDVLLHLEGTRPAGSAVKEAPASPVPAGPAAESVQPAAAPVSRPKGGALPAAGEAAAEPEQDRRPMSRIRLRIAERLLTARQNTAMLTTFNEIDMSRVIEWRQRYKDAFRQRHGVALGFMSFFVQATVAALIEFPAVNAFIDGTDIVYHRHVHMGIAIGADKGLVVPVIRYADRLGFAAIERAIVDFVEKIKANRLELSDLEGGTFTISNGGVYGSLLSTPILNTPQSGILGMHKIEDRPVVVDGAIVVRPMMYVALSYDHRLIDGREAVSFLRRIKDCVEHPERLLLEV